MAKVMIVHLTREALDWIEELWNMFGPKMEHII